MSTTPFMHPLLGGRLYVCQGVDILPEGEHFRHFVPDQTVQYYPLCDDFGPMNLSSVIKFTQQLDDDLESNPSCVFFYTVDNHRRSLANAVFLLGSYMILRLSLSSEDVAESFSWLEPSMVEAYRDATFAPSDFDLTLSDCWRGLVRGMDLGWLDLPREEDPLWGCIDVDEYDHYDDPLNGDLHEVVPGKFIAFKGPQDLGGAAYRDRDDGFREFSPRFYADLFGDFGVTAVVRLNEPHYDEREFGERGVAVHDLEFEDCTAPPDDVVEAFLRVVDAAAGAVAVHCKAGLGRTGTLIAVYLMRRHGFTAREAMGWLRIMRPGSVIGEQQHYLCGLDLEEAGGGARSEASGREAAAGARERCAKLAAQVAAGMERRGAARARVEGLVRVVQEGGADGDPVGPPLGAVADLISL